MFLHGGRFEKQWFRRIMRSVSECANSETGDRLQVMCPLGNWLLFLTTVSLIELAQGRVKRWCSLTTLGIAQIYNVEWYVSEPWVGKVMEGSSCSLVWHNTPAFAWRNWGKLRPYCIQASHLVRRNLKPWPAEYERGVPTAGPLLAVCAWNTEQV